MDKKILVEKVTKLINSFVEEGKEFSFVALMPIVGGVHILSVKADWLETFSTYDQMGIIIKRMFELFDKKTLRSIARVEIYSNDMELRYTPKDLILIDKVGFTERYNALLMQLHESTFEF